MYTHSDDPEADSNLTRISIDNEPADGVSANVQGVVGVSDDGKRVYFATTGQIVEGAPTAAARKIFLWDDTGDEPEVKYVAGVTTANSSLWSNTVGRERRRITPSGARLMFLSADEGITSESTGGVLQAFIYDAETSGAMTPSVTCVSCGPVGAASEPVNTQVSGAVIGLPLSPRRWFSEDGARAFFDTAGALLPQDTNGVSDVYMWENGTLELISSGRDSYPSTLVDADASGNNVFFQTREQLVGWDQDRANDIYVATVEGPMPEPAPEPSECQGEACQPENNLPPASLIVGSVGFEDGANVSKQPRVTQSLRLQKVNAGAGPRARLRVRVLSAGRIAVSGARVRRSSVVASGPGNYMVTIKLKPGARRALKKRKVLNLKVRVTFRSREGSAQTKALKLRFGTPKTGRGSRANLNRGEAR